MWPLSLAATLEGRRRRQLNSGVRVSAASRGPGYLRHRSRDRRNRHHTDPMADFDECSRGRSSHADRVSQCWALWLPATWEICRLRQLSPGRRVSAGSREPGSRHHRMTAGIASTRIRARRVFGRSRPRRQRRKCVHPFCSGVWGKCEMGHGLVCNVLSFLRHVCVTPCHDECCLCLQARPRACGPAPAGARGHGPPASPQAFFRVRFRFEGVEGPASDETGPRCENNMGRQVPETCRA